MASPSSTTLNQIVPCAWQYVWPVSFYSNTFTFYLGFNNRKSFGRITFKEMMRVLFPTASKVEINQLIQMAEPEQRQPDKIVDKETLSHVHDIFRCCSVTVLHPHITSSILLCLNRKHQIRVESKDSGGLKKKKTSNFFYVHA